MVTIIIERNCKKEKVWIFLPDLPYRKPGIPDMIQKEQLKNIIQKIGLMWL